MCICKCTYKYIYTYIFIYIYLNTSFRYKRQLFNQTDACSLTEFFNQNLRQIGQEVLQTAIQTDITTLYI